MGLRTLSKSGLYDLMFLFVLFSALLFGPFRDFVSFFSRVLEGKSKGHHHRVFFSRIKLGSMGHLGPADLRVSQSIRFILHGLFAVCYPKDSQRGFSHANHFFSDNFQLFFDLGGRQGPKHTNTCAPCTMLSPERHLSKNRCWVGCSVEVVDKQKLGWYFQLYFFPSTYGNPID